MGVLGVGSGRWEGSGRFGATSAGLALGSTRGFGAEDRRPPCRQAVDNPVGLLEVDSRRRAFASKRSAEVVGSRSSPRAPVTPSTRHGSLSSPGESREMPPSPNTTNFAAATERYFAVYRQRPPSRAKPPLEAGGLDGLTPTQPDHRLNAVGRRGSRRGGPEPSPFLEVLGAPVPGGANGHGFPRDAWSLGDAAPSASTAAASDGEGGSMTSGASVDAGGIVVGGASGRDSGASIVPDPGAPSFVVSGGPVPDLQHVPRFLPSTSDPSLPEIGWDGRGSQTSRAGRGGEGTFTGRPASRGNAGRGTAGLEAPRVPHDGEGTDHVVLEDLGVGLDAEFLRLFAP